jgi:hypothetical protein
MIFSRETSLSHRLRPALLVCFLALSACATAPQEPSGFLTSYDGFKPGPEGGVDRYWTPPEIRTNADFTASLRGYNQLLIDPIWVSMKKDKAYDGVDPQALKELVDMFHQELITAVRDRYAVVAAPGVGVLRISMALTGVESPNRLLAATSTFSPVGLGISTVSKAVTGEHTNVGSASMEALVSDSLTGKTLFAAIDREAGSKNPKNLLESHAAAKEAFKLWAGRLRKTLDASR